MSGYDFDQLIKDGETVEALRYFAKEGYQNGDFGHTRKQLIEYAAEQIEDQQAELDTLSMAHDEVHRLLPLDKHTLIKNIIALNKRVQELEELVEDYKTVNKELHQRGRKVRKQNRRYRATINTMGQIFKDAIHSLDMGEKIQGLEYGVKIANEALEGEE